MIVSEEKRGADIGLSVLCGAVVVSNILAWILQPVYTSFWTAHAMAILLWALLQAPWFSSGIRTPSFRKRLTNVVSAIALSISWTVAIIFFTSDTPAIALLGTALILNLLWPLLWVGYKHSKQQSRQFTLVILFLVIPAIALGAASAWAWNQAKEIAALSKLNQPVFTAQFEANTPNDPYWPRLSAMFSAVPGKGFSWGDALEATQHLGDDRIVPSDVKPVFEKTDQRVPDYRYVKTELSMAGIGISLEGAHTENFVDTGAPGAMGRRVEAYGAFKVRDQIEEDARRQWFYTAFPDQDGLLTIDRGENADAQEVDPSNIAESPTQLQATGTSEGQPIEDPTLLLTREEGGLTDEASNNENAARNMPRTHALVQKWREEGLEGQAMVDRALSYFQKNLLYNFDHQITNFEEASVDDFLFNERKGVCEQFANTFVRMMKSAGIPARVVSGFRGGDLDMTTGALVVRRRDAHAWAEVWMDEQGWVRVDPTDVVPVEKPVPDFGSSLVGQMFALPSLALENMSWGDAQEENRQGMRGRVFQWMGDHAATILLIAMPLVLVALLIMRRRYAKTLRIAKEDQAWETLREHLANKGYQATPSMGPRTLCEHALGDLPHALEDEWRAIVARYEQWKYATLEDDTLARDIRSFTRKLPRAVAP